MDVKKRQIVKIANRLFSVKGYSNTSVEEIAKESGMAKASLYKVFHNKEEILYESMLIFTQRIEMGLEELSHIPALSDEERLHHCILIYLECIFDDNVHLLMFNASDMITFESEKIHSAGISIEHNFGMWLTECLVEIYGEHIESFVMDIAFIIRGLVTEYVRMMGCRVTVVSSSNLNVFAIFLRNTIDISIQGILERKSEYTPLLAYSENIRSVSEGGPLMKKVQVKRILLDMEKTIGRLPLSDEKKTEYFQVMLQLKEEIPGQRAGSGLLKACFMYLEQVPELQGNCKELRGIFEITSGI